MQSPGVIIDTNMKHRPPKQPTPSFAANTQIIVTGKPLTPSQATSVIFFANTMSFGSWCSPEGVIGHLDGLLREITYEQLLQELKMLATIFPFLDMGVTVMSGPPGNPVLPVLSLKVQNQEVKKVADAHFGHPPPKRLKLNVKK